MKNICICDEKLNFSFQLTKRGLKSTLTHSRIRVNMSTSAHMHNYSEEHSEITELYFLVFHRRDAIAVGQRRKKREQAREAKYGSVVRRGRKQVPPQSRLPRDWPQLRIWHGCYAKQSKGQAAQRRERQNAASSSSGASLPLPFLT